MNRTKKLTQGAMMLAIIGALIVIDRMSAYWFAEFIVLFVPIVVIIYSAMYDLKDGIALSVGLLIITFLLSSFHTTYLIYIPVGIITGLVYSFFLKRNMSKNGLMIVAIFTYLICEIIANIVILPLFGFPVAKTIEQFKMAFEQASAKSGINLIEFFAAGGFDLGRIITVFVILSIVILGIAEGFMTHILTVFLLKRFKIMDLGNTRINVKANPVIAYTCFLAVISFSYLNRIENEGLYYLLCSISIIGMLVLFFYGYMFLVFYGRIVLKRNISMIVILFSLLMPALYMVVIVLGFLYASGPLYRYLEGKSKQ